MDINIQSFDDLKELLLQIQENCRNGIAIMEKCNQKLCQATKFLLEFSNGRRNVENNLRSDSTNEARGREISEENFVPSTTTESVGNTTQQQPSVLKPNKIRKKTRRGKRMAQNRRMVKYLYIYISSPVNQ